ncbi:MAG: superoxide dismutase [Gammaproteobacteria bacterium]
MSNPAMHNPRPAVNAATHHRLPALPYAVGALEPYIDARTMTLHHDMHHAGYVDKLNAALAELPQFQDASALWLLCNLSKIPDESRVAVHHSAGGHVNHSLFWPTMKPGPASQPTGALRAALCRSFGSVEAFETDFESAGSKHFGSGWAWLVAPRAPDGDLEIMTTAGHDNPMMKDLAPVLVNDLWEHAYYLHYENRRGAYLQAWWAVVDWDEAGRRFEGRGQPLQP